MPPPQRRQSDDDRSIGELARGQDAILQRLTEVAAEIKGLSAAFTPREVHDLALGGVKVDIRRIDEEQAALEKRLDTAVRTITTKIEESDRARAAEASANRKLVLGSLAFPILVAIVVAVLLGGPLQ